MRLYVHFEAAETALAWTRRLTVPPADDVHASPSVRRVLVSFFAAYNAKFRPKTPLGAENVEVYVEFHQNAASRRLLPSLDVSVAGVGRFRGSETEKSLSTCEFELFITPKSLETVKLTKKCQNHGENSSEEGYDRSLAQVLTLAEMQMKQRKFRAARDIYTLVVMAEDPQNPQALLALGDIFVACGRHEEAAEKYFGECWKVHGGADWHCKAHARLAFTSALKLAECYSEIGRFPEAVKVLKELQTFSSNTRDGGSSDGKGQGLFTDTDDQMRMEEELEVLKAKALYETKDSDNEEEAISLVTQLLPDLQASTLNLDALLLYATIAHNRGKKTEALSMALRVLVSKSNDRAVKKTILSLLSDAGAMERLQIVVPPTGSSAGSAYAFIATILKDFGAVEKSIACFQQAQICDPQSASYALNHAHALEACSQYVDAYNVLASFFRGNRSLAVGSGKGGDPQVLAGSFVGILDRTDAWNHSKIGDSAATKQEEGCSEDQSKLFIEWISDHEGYAKVVPGGSDANSSSGSHNLVQANKKTVSMLSDMDLDLLACFFTIVKLLFINGRLRILPALIHELEPLRLGRELHRTSIRNEQAYYACIAQLLSIGEALELDPPLSANNTGTIYVCGDSHTLATAWRKIEIDDRPVLLRPALVTGLKHWHLRKESTFYPKLNFWRVIASIPRTSRVIFLFGEIDCREGILDAVEKCKYETVEEGMQHTISIFMDVLEDVVKKYEFDVYIHPVVPVLDETRSLVVTYNNIFQNCVSKSSICTWLNFFDDLLCESPPKLRPEFRLDGTHLHPSYLARLEAALKQSILEPK